MALYPYIGTNSSRNCQLEFTFNQGGISGTYFDKDIGDQFQPKWTFRENDITIESTNFNDWIKNIQNNTIKINELNFNQKQQLLESLSSRKIEINTNRDLV